VGAEEFQLVRGHAPAHLKGKIECQSMSGSDMRNNVFNVHQTGKEIKQKPNEG
jgi:hypothetical protein